jgi:DNA-directed RNA polymerase specialized sigma24 family protein
MSTVATQLATEPSPRPNWRHIREQIRAFRDVQPLKHDKDPEQRRRYDAVRAETFAEVFLAMEYVAAQVIRQQKLDRHVRESELVLRVVGRKINGGNFTDMALAYDPDRPEQYNTFINKVMQNALYTFLDSAEYRHITQKLSSQRLSAFVHEVESMAAELDAMSHIPDVAIDGTPRRTPEEHVEVEQRDRLIQQAFSALPMELKVAISVDDTRESRESAAQRLGLSLSTYKRRRAQALDLIRGMMGIDV